jgi:chromosome segregation ATPase
MRVIGSGSAIFSILTCLSLIRPNPARAQVPRDLTPPATSVETSKEDIKTLAALVRQLQTQLTGLNLQIEQLRSEEQSARIEVIALRKELNMGKGQSTSTEGAPLQPH